MVERKGGETAGGHDVYYFPPDGGAAVKYGKTQIAVFNFTSRREWYATQNMCPHKQAFVLSRGIVGDTQGTTKVVCPLHKKNFSLQTGECISGEDYSIETFPVRIEGDVLVVLYGNTGMAFATPTQLPLFGPPL